MRKKNEPLILNAMLLPSIFHDSKPRMIDFKRSKILCHPAAKDAYLAYYSIPKIANHHLQKIDLSNPIFLQEITLQDNKIAYFFISSFDVVRQIYASNRTKVGCFIIKTTDIENLRIWAWYELIRMLNSKSLDPDIGLPKFRAIINQHMPTDLINYFFGARKLTAPQLCDLVGITKRQYDYQQIKLSARATSTSPLRFSFNDILEQAKNA